MVLGVLRRNDEMRVCGRPRHWGVSGTVAVVVVTVVGRIFYSKHLDSKQIYREGDEPGKISRMLGSVTDESEEPERS